MVGVIREGRKKSGGRGNRVGKKVVGVERGGVVEEGRRERGGRGKGGASKKWWAW